MDTFMHNQTGKPLDSYMNSLCNQFQIAKYPPNLKKRKADPLFDHHLQKSHSFSMNDPMGKSFSTMNPDAMKFYSNKEVSAIESDLEKNRYMVVLANQLSNNKLNFSNAYSNMILRNNIANAFSQQPRSVQLNMVNNGSNTTFAKVPPSKTSATDGDYQIVVGENLNSLSDSYEVLSFLGRGTFGQVVKCVSKTEKKLFAIKILKNHPSYLRQGNVEIQILQALSRQDTEAHNIVRAIECFQHKQHMCLVFELLEQNLYEYLKTNRFKPLSLKEIRPITQQVLVALTQLKNLGLIHADLKPENIMLVNPSSNGYLKYKVKVIDFGSACYSSKTVQNTYLQSRYYRAPEILLGLPFNEAIDMWSLGCVIAELFLGWPLYPGSSEFDQIRYIVETQGLPPSDMILNAGKGNRFFIKYSDMNTVSWRLKTHEEYFTDNGHPMKEARKYILSSLDQIREIGQSTPQVSPDFEIETEDRKRFAHLLTSMLQIRSTDRIQPETALLHPFITLDHFQAFPYTKKTHESVAHMQVCYRQKPAMAVKASVPVTPLPGGFLPHPPPATPLDHQQAPHLQQQQPFVFMNYYPLPNHFSPKKNNASVLLPQQHQAPQHLHQQQQRYNSLDSETQKGDMSSSNMFSSFYDLMSAASCNNANAISLLLAAASSKENNNSTPLSSKMKTNNENDFEALQKQVHQHSHHQQKLLMNQINASVGNYLGSNQGMNNAYYESRTIPQLSNETAAAASLLFQQQQQQNQRQANLSSCYQMNSFDTPDKIHFPGKMSVHSQGVVPGNASNNTNTVNSTANSNMSLHHHVDEYSGNRLQGLNAAYVQGILAAAIAQQKHQSHHHHQQQLLHPTQNGPLFQHILQQHASSIARNPSGQHYHLASSTNSLTATATTTNNNNLYYPSPTVGPAKSSTGTVGLNRSLKPCIGSNGAYSYFDVQNSMNQTPDLYHHHEQHHQTAGDIHNHHHEASMLLSNSLTNLTSHVHPHSRPQQQSASSCSSTTGPKSSAISSAIRNMLFIPPDGSSANGHQQHTHRTGQGYPLNELLSQSPTNNSQHPLNLSNRNSYLGHPQHPHHNHYHQHHQNAGPLGVANTPQAGGTAGGNGRATTCDINNAIDLQRMLENQLKYSTGTSVNSKAAPQSFIPNETMVINNGEYNGEVNLLYLLQQEAINHTRMQLKRLYPSFSQGASMQQALAAQLLLEQKANQASSSSSSKTSSGVVGPCLTGNPGNNNSKRHYDYHHLMGNLNSNNNNTQSWNHQPYHQGQNYHGNTSNSRRISKKTKDDAHLMKRMMWSMLENSWQNSSSVANDAASMMMMVHNTPESTSSTSMSSRGDGRQAQKRHNMEEDDEFPMNNNDSQKVIKGNTNSSLSKIINQINDDDEDDVGGNSLLNLHKLEKSQSLTTISKNYPANNTMDAKVTGSMTMLRPGNDKPIPVGRVQPMVKDQDANSNSIIFNSPPHGGSLSGPCNQKDNMEDQNLLANYVLLQLRNQGAVDDLDNEQVVVSPPLMAGPPPMITDENSNSQLSHPGTDRDSDVVDCQLSDVVERIPSQSHQL